MIPTYISQLEYYCLRSIEAVDCRYLLVTGAPNLPSINKKVILVQKQIRDACLTYVIMEMNLHFRLEQITKYLFFNDFRLNINEHAASMTA